MQLLTQLRSLWKESPTLRNILKVSFGDAASKVFSVATVLLLIRGLSIADYASYTTFSGISYLIAGIVGAGINMALVRSAADQISQGKEKPIHLYIFAIFVQLIIYNLLASVCLLFPARSTTLLFGEPALELPLQLGLLSGLGMLIIQIARTLYQAEEKFNTYIGTIWSVQIGIFGILISLWLSHHLSFITAGITFAVVQTAIGLLLLFNYLKHLGWNSLLTKLLTHKQELQGFITSSGWLIGYFLMLNLFSRMDVLMLLRFQGKEELAIYGVAFQYYNLSLLFLGSIHAVLLPRFSNIEMQEPSKQRLFLKQWLKWSVWLVVPIILFDLLGKRLFVWINGASYERSFPVFVILSIGIWLSMMFSPLVNILISRGKFRFLFFLSFLALICNFFSNLLLVPMLGGIGAAVVIILTQNIVIQIPILVEGLKQK